MERAHVVDWQNGLSKYGGEINFYIDRLRDNEVFEGVPVVH